MCCGIDKLKLHLQSDMKNESLLLDILNEGLSIAIILNLVKGMQSFCFLTYFQHTCNFQKYSGSICEIHYQNPAYKFSFIYK